MPHLTKVLALAVCSASLAACTHRSGSYDPNDSSTTTVVQGPMRTDTVVTSSTASTDGGMSTRMSSSSASGMHANHNEGSTEKREVHEAIHTLNRAQYVLEHASHEFGGHRAGALKAVDGALHELHKAAGQEMRRQTPHEMKLEDREIHRAVVDLERARRDMETAKHDFGGRRAETITAVDEALRELRAAEASEK